MHTANVLAPLASMPPPGAEEPTRLATLLAIAAAATLIIGPTLVALTHGWDYRLAVLAGTWLAAGALVVGRGAVRPSDAENRLELEFATAFVATLLCAYASDWLDWRPFGIDDALAGLTVGLAFAVAGPVRRALQLAERTPDEALFALYVLVLAPAVTPLLAHLHGQAGALQVAHVGTRVVAFGISAVLALLAVAFAARRGLYEAAFPLSLLSGLALLALFVTSGASPTQAALAGGLACLGLFLAGMRAWWRDGGHRYGWQPGGPLLWLTLAGAAIVNVHPGSLGWLVGALLAAWWWCESPRARPAREPGGSTWMNGATALSGALAVSTGALYFALGLLLTAAVSNATGPMLLANVAMMTPYRVSDLAFSELLLADQYLWRDTPAPSRLVAAASPDRLIQLMRTERDRWSGAERVAATRARMAPRPRGVGVQFGPESDDGIRVSYVYPGSPAERAGVRRGDFIQAINGVPIASLEVVVAAPRSPAYTTRFELAAPGQSTRSVTIEWAEYSRSAVTSEKVFVAGGRRVGYVVLHTFRPSASEEFMAAAARLRGQGIDELVLDLRMNNGGSVDAARDVASAIGGRRLDGEVFQRIVHNERYRDRDAEIRFRAPAEGALSLSRVIVITSEETCSASEALINGLAPFMTVVTVGTATCGKPVGMTVVEYGAHAYWVITFRVLNARGEGGYFDGLRPTCSAEDDFERELGDPDEASLAAALHYIRNGGCPDRPTRAAGHAS